jgi:hypothetical protein
MADDHTALGRFDTAFSPATNRAIPHPSLPLSYPGP